MRSGEPAKEEVIGAGIGESETEKLMKLRSTKRHRELKDEVKHVERCYISSLFVAKVTLVVEQG